MTFFGSEYNFRGTITVIPGDNLASQYLGGYKSLASALRKCRHCMAVDQEIQTKVRHVYISEFAVYFVIILLSLRLMPLSLEQE